MTATAHGSAAGTAHPGPTGKTSSDRIPTVPAERPVLFACEGERLLGILHPAADETGAVIIVGGPQYRAGSHRYFVQLGRALAAAGHPVLRFDARGMGDSSGGLRSFEATAPDIGAAIQALMTQQPHLSRIVLWGLCDGASAALLYLHEHPDPRVAGLCLLNPWVRSEQSLARTQVKHYYRQRLKQIGFWKKLLSGRVAAGALSAAWRSLAAIGSGSTHAAIHEAIFQERMNAAWGRFEGPICLLLSGRDYTAREFVEFTTAHPAWSALLGRPNVSRLELADADHTLSDAASRDASLRAILHWIGSVATGPAGSGRRG